MRFYHELAVACTGCDDGATTAYLAALAATAPPRVRAAAAHWEAADEPLREAIAPHLGFTEPTRERPPVNEGILAAYSAALDWAAEAIGEPQG